MKIEIVFQDESMKTFQNVASFKVTEEPNEYPISQKKIIKVKEYPYEELHVPIKCKMLKVIPSEINRSIFEKKRISQREEENRRLIQKAFDMLDNNPEKYTSPFYTMVPENRWESCYVTPKDLKSYANELGGYMADWVEQALEWAQRISDGESWDIIWKLADNLECCRMIVGKHGFYRIVGGSYNGFKYAMSYVRGFYFPNSKIQNVVPLVVIKKK